MGIYMLGSQNFTFLNVIFRNNILKKIRANCFWGGKIVIRKFEPLYLLLYLWSKIKKNGTSYKCNIISRYFLMSLLKNKDMRVKIINTKWRSTSSDVKSRRIILWRVDIKMVILFFFLWNFCSILFFFYNSINDLIMWRFLYVQVIHLNMNIKANNKFRLNLNFLK